MKRIFVAHYCNIPYQVLLGKPDFRFSKVDIEDLFIGAQHLMRNFELAPYAQEGDLEEKLIVDIKRGKLKT